MERIGVYRESVKILVLFLSKTQELAMVGCCLVIA